MNSLSFYQTFLRRLRQSPVVLATVIGSVHQSSTGLGPSLLLWEDGETFGSLGNSKLDIQLIQPAIEVLKTGLPQRITLSHQPVNDAKTTARDSNPHLQVWLNLWHGEDAMERIEAILAGLAQGQSMRLIMPLVAAQAPYVLNEAQERIREPLRNLAGAEVFVEDIEPNHLHSMTASHSLLN